MSARRLDTSPAPQRPDRARAARAALLLAPAAMLQALALPPATAAEPAARTATAASAGQSGAMSLGEVRKVDPSQGRITLRHGPIANLDMPGMTMVFRVADPALIGQVKEGDRVRFSAERRDGAITLTTIEVVE